MKEYHPLEVNPIFVDHVLSVEAARPWRLNLLAVSRKDPLKFFIALHDEIYVYQLLDPYDKPKNPILKLRSVNPNPPVIAEEDDPSWPCAINAIKVGMLGSEEVLVSVDDSGEVRAWFTEKLDRSPLCFSNNVSTWGIALNGPRHLLAVSANSHNITVYSLRGSRGSEYSPVGLESDTPLSEFEDPLYTTTDLHSQDVNDSTRTLKGHKHNVPNIDISPCGEFLASCSIDGTCRVWNLLNGETIYKNSIGDAWGWTALFVSIASFKHISSFALGWENTSQDSVTNVTDLTNPLNPLSLRYAIDQWRRSHRSESDEIHSNTELILMNDEITEDSVSDDDIEYGYYNGSELADQDGWSEGEIDEYDDWNGFDELADEEDADTVSGDDSLDDNATEAMWEVDTTAATVQSDDHYTITTDELETGSTEISHDVSNSRATTATEESNTTIRNPPRHRNRSSFTLPSTQTIPQLENDSTNSNSRSIPFSYSQIRPLFSTVQQRTPLLALPAPTLTEPPSPTIDTYTSTPKPSQKKLPWLILYSTVHDLLLLDPSKNLSPLHCEKRIISKVDNRRIRMLNSFDRLCMIEWIEELGLAVIASQKGKVALVRALRICTASGEETFMLNSETYLPLEFTPSAPLLGMFVSRFPPETHPQNLPDPALQFYHLYLLYYNGAMLCYELRRKKEINPLRKDDLMV
ncbi:hypothetical protein K7432_006173 [Basidiobolus ranarum]|uniref:Uncharacterized protein n=1 Tax=Basidiobolus ranarum TaxID=34480 RepID=A0ABR2W2Y3_9FUNG